MISIFCVEYGHSQTLCLYNVPENVAKVTKDHILQNDALLMEVNPGLGFLTELLLDSGVPRIRAFQPYPSLLCRVEVRNTML